MKKTMLLSVLAGLAGAFHAQADTDVYITGSTAFRVQVAYACSNMFVGGTPSIAIADTGGYAGGTSDSLASGKNYVWTMSGTAASALTNISGTLSIHANFTGSVQGIKAVEQANTSKLTFLDASGIDSAAHVTTNSPTIAFSDVLSSSTPYPVGSGYGEDKVAIQPFVFVKSINSALAGVTNISWMQAKSLIQLGTNSLANLTGKPSDAGTTVYMVHRTKDSGTRRTALGELDYKFNSSFPVNVYYHTPNNWTNYPFGTAGNTNNVIGSVTSAGTFVAGNLNWGPGYVGGGDVKNVMKDNGTANTSIGYLSFSDASGITGVNWSQVISFNGVWPTTNGPSLVGILSTGTNDFTPVINGQYSYWAEEVVVYPNTTGSMPTDSTISQGQLGSQSTPGTFLGVLNYVGGGTNFIAGSIDNEINKQSGIGKTAINLWQMQVNHNGIGGVITPGHY